jgi:hypothetical protein
MKATKLFVRPVRFLIALFIGAIVFFGQISPAAAVGSVPRDPSEGPAQLDDVQKESEDTLRRIPGMEEVQRKSNEGLNEVQGAADADKMYNPSNSQQAESIEEEAEGFLKKLTGKK